MGFIKKICVFAIICLSVACFLPSALAEEELKEQTVISILTVNDFHGALVENGKNPGMTKLAGFLREEVALNPAGTIIVSAGDMFQGTPESNMLYGKPVVAAMNELEFAAMAIGNHEFDWGIEVLKERIGQAKFPFLAANIIDKASGQCVSFVKPYTIVEKNGVKIALIGLTTPETATKTNPKYSKGYIFAEPVKTVRNLIPILKQQGADIIVVLSHLGSEMNMSTQAVNGEAADLALGAPGINAVISGHTHMKVAGVVNSVPIVQAGYNGRYVGKLSFSFSKINRQAVYTECQVIDLAPSKLAADEAVREIVDKAQQEVGPVKNKVFGFTTYALEHDKFTHSVLGEWVTDIMRQKANADVAFTNGGGLRSSIPAGEITLGSLYQVIPFDNTLVTLEMTGKQILEVLEHGIYNKQIGMVQFSGISVEYDKENRKISRVTLPDGSSLNITKTYKVVTNDFMAQGGDGFSMFNQSRHKIDTQIPLRDCLVEAVTKAKTINAKMDKRFLEFIPVNVISKPAA